MRLLFSSLINSASLMAISLVFSANALALNVVTTIKPLHSIVSNVTAGISEPVLLMDKQVSAHHYNLTPRNRLVIAKADVIYWIGPDIESTFSSSLRNNEKAFSVLDVEGLARHELRETHNDSKQSDGHQHHGDHEHTEEIDPHIWLDTNNALIIARAVAEKLAVLDAKNAQAYQNNVQIFADKIRLLNSRLAERYAGIEKQAFATLHDAFQYNEKQFNLNHVSNISLHPTLPLSGKQRLLINKTIRRAQIACIFYDPAHHPKAAQQLASQEGIRLQSLDPIGYGLEVGVNLYDNLLENLAEDISGCLAK